MSDNAEDRLRAVANDLLFNRCPHDEQRCDLKGECSICIHAALEAAIADARQSWRSRMGLSGTNAEALDAEYQKGRAAGVAEEREACAKSCEEAYGPWDTRLGPQQNARHMGRALAGAIRARGLEEKP